jgi:hypothetical protein
MRRWDESDQRFRDTLAAQLLIDGLESFEGECRTYPAYLASPRADLEKVFAAAPSAWTSADIFAERGIGVEGAVVVVRPDQYVAHVLPLSAPERLAHFFAGVLAAPSIALQR